MMIYKSKSAYHPGMKLYDTFTGGKYKGYTLHYVLQKDKGYILWATKHISTFVLDEEAQRILGGVRVPVHEVPVNKNTGVSRKISIVQKRKLYLSNK